MSSDLRILSEDEELAEIQKHKDYLAFRIGPRNDMYPGKRYIAGPLDSVRDRRIVTVKHFDRFAVLTECGLRFSLGTGEVYAHRRADCRWYLYDIHTTYQWLNPELPIDLVKEYLKATTEYVRFAYGASHYDWVVGCFKEGGPMNVSTANFLVSKQPVSRVPPRVRDRLERYRRDNFPLHKIITFEEMQAWRENVAQ